MPRRFRRFLSKQEKSYLEFLKYSERYGHEIDNRADWDENEKTPHRYLDYKIRRKTKEVLIELRLVFEKFGYGHLFGFSDDLEITSDIRFLIETINSIRTEYDTRFEK